MFICNPIPPTLPDDYELNNGYWDEADRYTNEYLLQQSFKEEKEKNEGHNNPLQK